MISILNFIKKLDQPVFTTAELSAISKKSLSNTTQSLNYLQKQGIILKIHKGIWTEITDKPLSPYGLIPFLFPLRRCYLSFISALHLYGIIEQIPQVITLASTGHTKTIVTELGTFSIHQIAPNFFKGFDWYKNEKSFLIAEPEKALADCLYLAGYKKKQFSHFPELRFPKNFSFKKTKEWIKKIPNPKVRSSAMLKLTIITKERIKD
jgi:predicted transcriptional regulator of viral defense system